MLLVSIAMLLLMMTVVGDEFAVGVMSNDVKQYCGAKPGGG